MVVVSVLDKLAVNGNGELGFDSGEWALEIADSSKECSRRVNYSMRKTWSSEQK